MSGKLKEVRTRIGSVKSTQQITKAMKLVAASKLRRAQSAIIQMRPYSRMLSSIMANIADATEGEVDIPYAKERMPNKVMLVIITSNRGLCGGFNTNIIKQGIAALQGRYAAQYEAGNVSMITIGKKGNDAFKHYSKLSLNTDYTNLFEDLSFENSAVVSEYLMKAFREGTYDVIEVAYAKFKNAAVQIIDSEKFLPIAKIENEEKEEEKGKNAKTKPDYIFEPSKLKLIEELVPKILNTQFYRYVLDNNASEHGARMTAMDAASENAEELLGELKLSYNKARQAAITTEITEIAAGADALKGN